MYNSSSSRALARVYTNVQNETFFTVLDDSPGVARYQDRAKRGCAVRERAEARRHPLGNTQNEKI